MATLVKNPNYDPLDKNSKRFISVQDAIAEAQNKAVTINDLFKPFGNLFKPLSGLSFFTPPAVADPTIPTTPTPLKPTGNNVATNTPVQDATVGAQIEATKQVAAPTNVLSSTYTIQAGDTLGAIAARTGTTVDALAKANNIRDPNRIQAGATLIIPTSTTVPAPTAGGATPEVPQTEDTKTDQALSELARRAGEAGLGLTEYLKVVEGRGIPTREESSAIRNKLGIPDLIDETFKKPERETIEIYRELYNLAGLNEIKSQIQKINESINQKRADLIKATGELNNNPWISQSTRAGRLKNLQELAFADINNDIQQKQQLLDLYDQGVDEIERQISFIAEDTELDRSINAEKLNFLLNEAEREETLAQREVMTEGLRNIPEFLQGILNREATEAQRALRLKSTTSSAGGGTTSTPLGASNELLNAFNRSVLGLSKDARSFATSTFNDLLAQGRVDEAKSFILQIAIETADAETARKLIGREEALAAVDDIRNSLERYIEAGGKTNALRGGYEKMLQKLGKTSDPTLAGIENDIKLAIQSYRQAVSGAAFTESESEEYQSVFPDINRSYTLNMAKLDSLEQLLTRNQEVFFKQKLGNQNYNNLFGAKAKISNVPVRKEVENLLSELGY